MFYRSALKARRALIIGAALLALACALTSCSSTNATASAKTGKSASPAAVWPSLAASAAPTIKADPIPGVTPGCGGGKIAQGADFAYTDSTGQTSTIVGGRCFDEFEGAASGQLARLSKSVYDSFCSKLGLDDQLAAVLGHGLITPSFASSIETGDNSSKTGSCQYTNSYIDYATKTGTLPKMVDVSFAISSSEPEANWTAATSEIASTSSSQMTQQTLSGIGTRAVEYSQDTPSYSRSILTDDGTGRTVLVTTNAPQLQDLLKGIAQKALAVAAAQPK